MADTVLILKYKVYVVSALLSDGEYQLNIVCKLIIEIQKSNSVESNSKYTPKFSA